MQFFWFSLGVLHGFSRKSNEDEFFRKTNWGMLRQQIQKTRGEKKKQFFRFSLGVLHGFSRKSNEDEFSGKQIWGSRKHGEQKKKIGNLENKGKFRKLKYGA